MNWISCAFFLLAIHSIGMILFIHANNEWYYQKAFAAGVEPNLAAATVSKLILAAIGIGVGVWLLN